MIPLSNPDIRRVRFPYLTIALITFNATVFLFELTLGSADRSAFFYRWGLIPAELAKGADFKGLLTEAGVLDIDSSPLPAWGTVFTSMFIHGGFLHFAGNMLFLWVFGATVEDRLGHLLFVLLYLATGVAAAWTQVAMDLEGRVPTIGASGAIAGVLGAYLVLYPGSRINTLVIFYFITMIRIPAVYLLGAWFLLQLFNGVGSLGPSAQASGGVAFWAHVGGFIAGLLAVVIYLLLRREPIGWNRWRYHR